MLWFETRERKTHECGLLSAILELVLDAICKCTEALRSILRTFSFSCCVVPIYLSQEGAVKIGIISFAIGFLQFKCIILSDYMLWRKKKTKNFLTLHTSKHIFYPKSLLGFWVCKSATAMPTKTMWKFQWWVCHHFHTLWLVVWSLVCMSNILGKGTSSKLLSDASIRE